MANIYKKVNADLVSATQKDVYTVPGNTRALIKSIHVYNWSWLRCLWKCASKNFVISY